MIFLGVVQNGFRVILPPITGGPLLHLIQSSPAEPQQLVPVVFHEEQDAGNHFLLFPLVVAKGGTVDMDVEAGGTALMAEVAHMDRFCENSVPGHFVHVIVQGHWVSDNLHSVIQGAIMFDVDMGLIVITDLHQPIGSGIALTALVNFKLHAEVAGALPIEDGLWLVVIALNALAWTAGLVAGIAVALSVIVVQIIEFIIRDQSSAAAAVGIAVPAGVAEGQVLFLVDLVGEKALAAIVTDRGQIGETVQAVQFAPELMELRAGVIGTTMGTGECLSHRQPPPPLP